MKCYVKDYPRPQFVRKDWENLNGIWDFSFDDSNVGEQEKWYCDFPAQRTICVPFSYETAASGIGDETCHENVWYYRTLSVDAEKLKGNRYILHFEGSDYVTKVWVNGQFAGSHKGGYTRFSFDITDALQPGENTIAVHTYYQGLINRVWVSGDQLQCLYLDLTIDGQPVLTSDETWLCTDHTGFTSLGTTGYETQFLECYNSSAPEVGFEQPNFDDSNWQRAAVLPNPAYQLVPQPTKQLAFETISPKTIQPIPGGLRIDLGFEAVAYLNLTATGEHGDIITIRCGEELNEDGSVRYNMRCNCCYEVTDFVYSLERVVELDT